MERTSVSLTREQLDDAQREAERRGVSRSQLIREALLRDLGRGDLAALAERVARIEAHLGI